MEAKKSLSERGSCLQDRVLESSDVVVWKAWKKATEETPPDDTIK
jgi:hypothetical protein